MEKHNKFIGKLVKIELCTDGNPDTRGCSFMVVADVTNTNVSRYYGKDNVIYNFMCDSDKEDTENFRITGLGLSICHGYGIDSFEINIENPMVQKLITGDPMFNHTVNEVSIEHMKDYLNNIGYFSQSFIDDINKEFMGEMKRLSEHL